MTCSSLTVCNETFPAITERWNGLISGGAGCTVFDLPTWQQTWWEHFGEGKQARILTVCTGDRIPDLLAPLMQDGSSVSFIGGTDLVDYHDFVRPGGLSEECVDAVLEEVGADRTVSRLEFLSIAEDSDTLEVLPGSLSRFNWETAVEVEDVAPRLKLPGSWDEYLAGLRKKDRHELRRKLRRLEAVGEVEHLELSAAEDVETALPDFFELHRMSTPDKQEFMTSGREAFFRDVAVRLAHEGVTRLSFLELGGERVACSLSFVVNGVRFLYNSGYNPELSWLSVGLLNHAYSIRRSIEAGLDVFDFMRGDEPYKYHLGGLDTRVFRVIATR